MKNPHSLITRVFKVRYFRNDDIMNAKVKTNCSFVWRSIVWSKPIIEKCMRWKVGDGTSIKVFGDRWVQGLHGARVANRGEGADPNMRVAELIKAESQWKVQMINNYFLPHECVGILGTPIREKRKADEIWWEPEQKENFTVKSAYLLAKGYYEPHEATSSIDRQHWNRLVWSASIHPKARMSMWRAIKNFILTVANLKEHHVLTDGICPLCKNRLGSTEHSPIFCMSICETWKRSRFWRVLTKGTMLKLRDIAACIRKKFNKEEYEVWVVILWKIWSAICKNLYGDEGRVDGVTEEECMAAWEAYQSAKPTYSIEEKLGFKCGERIWRRPISGRYRVDVDVLFNQEANAFGVGVIARNSEGKVVVAMSKQTGPHSNVMVAEIMAVVNGITLCMEHQLAPIQIYTDSFLAARTMLRREKDEDFLPEDIHEILEIARSNMLIGVFHMYRSVNSAAHSLAQFAVHCPHRMIWTDKLPQWLEDIVTKDLNE